MADIFKWKHLPQINYESNQRLKTWKYFHDKKELSFILIVKHQNTNCCINFVKKQYSEGTKWQHDDFLNKY